MKGKLLHLLATGALMAALMLPAPVNAQKKEKKKKGETPAAAAKPATQPATAGGAGTAAGRPQATGPQPHNQVVTAKAKTTKGLFTVHLVDDKYLFEIPDSLIGREFMAITRQAKVPAGAGYGGELANRQVLRWEKGPGNKLFLRVALYLNVSPDSTQPIAEAVRNSNMEPIAAAFDIKAIKKDTCVVVDVTDFFKGDNQVVSITPATKRSYNLTTIQADRSYIESIKSFPINTEVRTVKTFALNPASLAGGPTSPGSGTTLPAGASSGVLTMEINTSMILLPREPMKRRFFDSRVGFFANGYTVYNEESQKTERETFIVRWRLEPKDEDIEKMKRGELVEPKKPIVFYIDPATPKKWRSYLKAGVEDWKVAFEQAGFKNAILAKDWPENDPNFSLEDARYSVIRYFASNIENAYGPNVHDPRSGEILESHIGWYHNVMNLLKKWYTIQGAAVDPRARKPEFDDELMGQLIRFVSAHEVGHTLGLRHNFGSSYATPVEKLRDKEFLSKYGHTASIMDYARFNYVAQPEDGITDLFPKVGTYDKWAIEWGYKPIFDTKSPEEDKKILNKWILAHANDPMYWFGTESNPYDPRSQSEDLGNNAMKASEYGIRNLKRILPNLPTWYKREAENYSDVAEMYAQVVGQYRRYMGHVTKYIGGIYETPKSNDQEGVVYEPTPRNLQKEAVAFLNAQLFTTPTWLLDKNVMPLIRPDQGVEYIRSIQEATLNSIYDVSRLSRLIETGSTTQGAYTIDELFSDVHRSIWSEVATRRSIDVYRRNLQKSYVEKMASLLKPSASPAVPAAFAQFFGPSSDMRKNDIMSIVRAYVIQLRTEVRAALPAATDKMTRYHLQDALARLDQALDPK